MNKKKTLLVALLVASAFVTKAQSQQETSRLKVHQQNSNHPSELTNFLIKNSTVTDVSWKSHDKIVIRLKNGKVQTYNLGDLQQRQTFENKYGTVPTAPPPPPPPPSTNKQSK